jgi:uncharacterized protein (DUF427 family)
MRTKKHAPHTRVSKVKGPAMDEADLPSGSATHGSKHEEGKAMTDKPIKQPGPDHPITIEPNPARIVVSIAGQVLADTQSALTLREADYPPVQYIPLDDVDRSLIEATDHASYCPFKGDASYYSIPAGGERSVNAIWTYRDPHAAVAEIKDHVAFYPDRVDAIDQQQ